MKASDYTISLEMAQRHELHAAMRAAGFERSHIHWRWIKLFAESDWELNAHNPFRVVPAGELDAYHTGELLCACEVLAARITPRRAVMINTMEGYNHAGAWATWAESGDDLFRDPFHTDKLPDALAELCIALHARQIIPPDAPAQYEVTEVKE